METINATIEDIRNVVPGMAEGNTNELEGFKHRVDDIFTKVDKLERRVNEVEQFYLATSKKQPNNPEGGSMVKENDKEKRIPSIKKQQREAACREASKRMHELMRQFGTILRQAITNFVLRFLYLLITQHKWAWPFRQPVDVEGLGLQDYYEEKRQEEEEAEAKLAAQEAAHAKTARDLSNELYELDTHLEELREMLVQKCRKMSNEEKRKLGVALSRLSPEHLSRALEIVAQNNPSFRATAEVVELDIDAQSESTLWRLKFFVKDALEIQGKGPSIDGNKNNGDTATTTTSKQKRDVSDTTAKNAKKRCKKL
ncbi:transcription factor GTE6 [Actinidia rufa]|uniref:Transcription factor GTE6 n=1 Tax=Actinidia rufa TaxID=165716 RepID=A0A7J0GVD4_9ERIC|nr:transcription factor GTE6 [Actinidia rufa]